MPPAPAMPDPEMPGVDPAAVAAQTAEVLDKRREEVRRQVSRLLAGLMALQWLVSLTATEFHSLLIRVGVIPRLPFESWGDLTFGGLLTLLSLGLALARPRAAVTRHALAASLILSSPLLGRVTGGQWDAHLHVFGALAFLALYRDWRVLVSASLLAAVEPAASGLAPAWDVWARVQHGCGVLTEDALLLVFCRQSLREMRRGAEREALLALTGAVVTQTLEKRRSSETALHDAREQLRQTHQELEEGARLRAEELARANEALQRNVSVLRAQQEATVDGVLVVNEERDVSSYNHRFCELWHIPGGLMEANEDWTMLQHILSCVKNPDAFLALMDRCYRERDVQCQDEVELNDGRIFERCTRPIFSPSGQYYGRVWYFRDVTDRRQAETQILGLNRKLMRANEAIMRAYDATIEGWSRALDLRDKETEGHSRRVTDLTLRLALALGMCGDELIQVRRGALLHDIGKMGVPDHILLKPGPLSDDERTQMCRHPQLAYEMLSPIEFLRPALDIPWCHHERWDGTGYPRGLAGEEIPLAARLFAIVDVWDALISDRPYRAAWPDAQAREHMQARAGTHFDPAIIPVFLSLVSHEEVLPQDDLWMDIELFPSSEAATDSLPPLRRAA